jgi:hypothetical protein
MAKYIFHIADIHIHERNYAHIFHSWKILIRDIIAMPNYTKEIILVIAGDIFDHKTYLTAGDVRLFYDMMEMIELHKINTIMMPGNHDYNINSSKDDKIYALVNRMRYQFIKYFSTSIEVEILGVVFFIHSPIDQIVIRPDKRHLGKKTVAMVHEPLSESVTCSGITFGSQRFSASDFTNIFDMTMMGDIHMPQLLAPNVVYSGSFVQKNKGEDINHGYMKWDVATCKPVFIKIDQLSLHIKIWANDNKMNDMPSVVARSVTLYFTNCDDKHVDKFKKQLESLYSCKVDIFDKTIIQNDDGISDTKDVKDLGGRIISNLNSMTLSESQNSRVSEIHSSMFSESKHESCLDWKIRFLSWSNVYCYGENNYINFDEIGNLTSMIGVNKVGKSSIIDILMIILFNQTSRGSKKHALHVDSSNAFIKCVISVGSDEYSIERAWIDKKTVAVRLYKNGENITNEDIVSTYKIIGKIVGSKRVFINSNAALQQRQFIVDLGSKEIYELVCRMMDFDKLREIEDQNNTDIRQLKKQISNLQTKISGINYKEFLIEKKTKLISLRLSYKSTKNAINETQTRISLISVDLDEQCESSSILSTKLSSLEQYKKYDNDNDNVLIKLNGDLVDAWASIEVSQRDITLLSARRDVIKDELRHVSTDINLDVVTHKIKMSESIDIDNCLLKVSNIKSSISYNLDKIEDIKKNINEAERALKDYGQLSKKIFRNSSLIHSELKGLSHIDFTEKEKELVNLQITIAPLEISLAIAESNRRRNVDEYGFYERYDYTNVCDEFNCVNIEKEKKTLKDTFINTRDLLIDEEKKNIILVKQLQDKTINISIAVAIENTQSKMEWNSECECCTKNNNTFNTSIMSVDDSNEKLLIDHSSRCIVDHKTNMTYIENKLKRMMLFEIYSDDKLIEETMNKIKNIKNIKINAIDNINISKKNNDRMKELKIEADIAEKNELILTDILFRTRQITNGNESINNFNNEILLFKDELINANKPVNELKEALLLKTQYKDYIHNDSIKYRLNSVCEDITLMTINVDSLKMKCIDWKKKFKTLNEIKTLHLQYIQIHRMMEKSLINEDVLDEIKELDFELIGLIKKLEVIENSIESVSIDIGKYEQLFQFEEKQMEEISILEQSCSDRVIYDKIINHKSGVPERMMKIMCANIQSKCNIILQTVADFEIEVLYDKEISINTKVCDKLVLAEQASGYQKFIIDLILRQVLCSLTKSSHPRILFVDEGFGALDKHNFINVCKIVLPALAKHFEKVIIISHIKGIHDYTIDNCIITKINERSHIQYGKLSFNGLSLRVIEDHKTYTRNIKEQKDVAKIINNAEKTRKQKCDQVYKDTEEKRLNIRAIEKQEEYGESIVESVDENTMRCMACDKTYRRRNGFAKSHITGTAHMKCMRTFE